MYAVLASETAFAATHLLMSFLMTVGVCTRQRCLMIPYLVIQMIVIILFVVVREPVWEGYFENARGK